jgi:hypothetical protein
MARIRPVEFGSAVAAAQKVYAEQCADKAASARK